MSSGSDGSTQIGKERRLSEPNGCDAGKRPWIQRQRGLGMEGYGSGTHSAGARVCECGAYTVRSRREEPESKIGKVKQVHASKLQI